MFLTPETFLHDPIQYFNHYTNAYHKEFYQCFLKSLEAFLCTKNYIKRSRKNIDLNIIDEKQKCSVTQQKGG